MSTDPGHEPARRRSHEPLADPRSAHDVPTALRTASEQVRSAVATLPRPAPPGAPAPAGRGRPALALVAVVAVVGLVVVGLTGWLGGTQRSAPAPGGTPIPTRASQPSPSTSPDGVALQEAPSVPAEPVCGADLPVPVYPPTGWDGPQPGPADASSGPALPGQLVVHWSGPKGAFEVRWPADPSDGVGYDPMESASVTEVDSVVVLTSPVPGAEPPCAHLSVSWFGDVPAAYGKGISLGGPPSHKAVFATLVAPRDLELVTRTRSVTKAPAHALPCEEAPEPRRKGTGGPASPQPTPEQALQAFLDARPNSGMNASGWTKFREADGGIVFGVPFEGGSGWVQLVRVEQVGDGWTVGRWETSGC